VLIDDAQSKIYTVAVIMYSSAVFLFILLLLQFIICCGCDRKIQKNLQKEGDDENQPLLESS